MLGEGLVYVGHGAYCWVHGIWGGEYCGCGGEFNGIGFDYLVGFLFVVVYALRVGECVVVFVVDPVEVKCSYVGSV